jgi:phospholipid/cholesterol/gamma-HCH transport system substrate-binding protein
MIERRTKVQLLVFAVITLLGVSFVGARYAQLDRLVRDDTYEVVAHFSDSGGIFAGGEVTYRGVKVGQVDQLELTDDGVDVVLSIDNAFDSIPADAIALVGNRSAVGEQYVELQPQSDAEPFLEDDSEIPVENTQTPIKTQVFLTNLSDTVESVDKDALRTTVTEFGKAFGGTGDDLGQIIDTGNAFIEDANENFDVTTALIRDSNTVLQTQADSTSAIRTFAKNLAAFSGTLAGADGDLRQIIDSGSTTANELRRFIEDNEVVLGELINNVITTGEVAVAHLDGIEQVLVVYPYVVEGGFTVVSKSPGGLYDAHFGLITQEEPHVCNHGYESTNVRKPQDGSNAPMNMDARCLEPAAQSNARGAQHAPPPRAAASYDDAPVVATYDPDTGGLRWGTRVPRGASTPGTLAPSSLGEESWKWLFLQPLAAKPE